MRKTVSVILVLVMLMAGFPAEGVLASAPAVDCAEIAASLGAAFQEGAIGNAKYCVIKPPNAKWNRDLVIFAHGYVPQDFMDPDQAPEIPWDQMIRAEFNLPGILVNLGYAFATTSYSKTGLAVTEGVQDVLALAKHVKKTDARLKRVFLTGASEGGLVTTLALEQNPAVFSGGMATCGPIGDFQKQINAWGDFRVVFDHYFPGLVETFGGSAVDIPPALIALWGSTDAPGKVMQATYDQIKDPAKKTEVTQLFSATKAPVDLANLAETVPQTVIGILDYNIKATNEGKLELGGNPYFNRANGDDWQNIYKSFPLDPTLNLAYPLGVARFEADPAALANIQKYYQTQGSLSRPLVIMHTTGDPIVPFWHAQLYLKNLSRKVPLVR